MLPGGEIGSRTHRKALEVNLDPRRFGTFAEIGAGQEVARWFFQAGGASQTIAKSISAYDMGVSDALYGPTQRYVSRQRLEAMLDREYQQLTESLGPVRGDRSTFFAFADTVATRSAERDQHGRGWVGIRFQAQPRQPPSTIILHGVFFTRGHQGAPVLSLIDDLSGERIEIDMLKVSGPAFVGIDNRILSLQLVEHQLTDAAMFTAAGEVVQPSEVLHRRPVLVERGSFRPATRLTVDLLERAKARFLEEPEVRGLEPVVLAEMTLRNLKQPDQDRAGPGDFLARAEILHVLGVDVLVSRFGPFYQLADYLAAYTDRMLGIAVGVPTLNDLLDEQFSTRLDGGALEAVGRLFKRSVKLYVYPTRDPVSGRIVSLRDPVPTEPAQYLLDFVLAVDRLRSLEPSDPSLLTIRTPDVLARIQAGDPSWKSMVPQLVAERIQSDGLFGYRSAA
jgi:hypothetical protein